MLEHSTSHSAPSIDATAGIYAPIAPTGAPIVVAAAGSDAPTVLGAARAILGDAHRDAVAIAILAPLTQEITIGEAAIFPPELHDEWTDALAATLERDVTAIAPGDERWSTRVDVGDPADVIARVALETNAALIVMGLGRHRIIDRIVGTETALRAIQLAPCPVLAVSPDLHAQPRTVVVATDFSDDGIRAAESALPFLAADATLFLVHVWEPNDSTDERGRWRDEDYRRLLPERFARVVAALRVPASVTVRCETREGRSAERLLDFAAAHSADLIVAGRHGLGTLRRLLVGSVTSALVRGARCSVLIAPQPTPAELARRHGHDARSVESRDAREFRELLHDFAARNAGRRLELVTDDDSGCSSRDRGYSLLDLTYDDTGDRVELRLAPPKGRVAQRTFAAAGVRLVDVLVSGAGVDASLMLEHASGRAALMFLHD